MQSQKNTGFTWFTAKGYIYKIVADFTIMEKIIQEIFTIQRH